MCILTFYVLLSNALLHCFQSMLCTIFHHSLMLYLDSFIGISLQSLEGNVNVHGLTLESLIDLYQKLEFCAAALLMLQKCS